MTYKQQLKEMEKFAKEVSSSKEKAIKFLQEAGIVTKSGKRLAKQYR